MMDFIIAIVAICTLGTIINNWIRAKHGYPLKDDDYGDEDYGGYSTSGKDISQLKEQNRILTDKLENATDRIAVLERIVTDSGYHTAREIEALRDLPVSAKAGSSSGVPLDIKKEAN